MTPINGRVSDIVARRPMLFAAIGSFLAFSALCGGAKNITWLIVARAFAGLGGGSVVSLRYAFDLSCEACTYANQYYRPL